MKQTKRKQYSQISDIVTALKHKDHLQNEIRKYYYADSELCRALQQYIEKDPQPHCLLKLDRQVINSSAHSGVHFLDVRIYSPIIFGGTPPTQHKIEDQLVFTFNVDLIDPQERETTDKVTVSVPASFEKNFTKEKFVKWIKNEKRKIVKNKDERIILEIAAKYDVPIETIKSFLNYL